MRTMILGLLASVLVISAVSSGASELELDSLVPDHVVFTVKKSPVLYFYISHATSLPIRFILSDLRKSEPVADVLLPSPTRSGYVAIRLEDYRIVLDEDEQYRWFVAVERELDRRHEDIVSGGMIERIDARLVDYYGHGCDRESVIAAENAGLWLDAFACVNELIEANPEDRQLRSLRYKLLKQEKILPGDELLPRPMGFLDS